MSSFVKKRARRAVSPIVAVLILIVVAVVGGGAVAVLMGNITSQTSQQVSSQGIANKTGPTLVVGGSDVVFPITEILRENYTAQTGVSIADAQGGDRAGIVGVAQGVLDIGSVSNYDVYLQGAHDYASSNLKAFEIAGSAVAIISSDGNGGFITDGTNACQGITKDALDAIYSAPAALWHIKSGGCSDGIINKIDVDTSSGGYTAYNIGDGSATETAFDKYVGLNLASETATSAHSDQAAIDSVNNSHTPAIGIVDFSYVHSHTDESSFANLMVVSSDDSVSSLAQFNDMTPVAKGDFVHDFHDDVVIKSLSGVRAYPDSGGSLLVKLYYVTKGDPTASEQSFINYVRSPERSGAMEGLGYGPYYTYECIAATGSECSG